VTAAPTTTAAPAARPARTCGWTIAPQDTPNGGRLGFLHLTTDGGRTVDHYRVRWLECDDMATAVEVSKELPNGAFAESYRVVLPAPGAFGRPVCSCPGWRFGGKCRHGSALQVLLSKDLQ
jgi:hypothetical protein